MNPKLQSFVTYCEENPTERFWQALRNWSGAEYILKNEGRISAFSLALASDMGLKDTFYIEDDEV